uniref:Glucosyltransferase n=1 Tax=Solanum tuberosum TaxID=4113 RepID=M1CVU4_SOLTU
MVPFPAQGHLNQLLQLSCLISSYGLPVYYVGLATHNHQARIRANALNPSNIAKIHFHDLPNPELIAFETIWDASMLLHDPIASFIRDISSKISVQHEEELLTKLYSLEGVTTDEAMDLSDSQHPYMDIRSGDIHNTSKVIESKYIDLMEQAEISLNKKQWAIGPILPTKLDYMSNRENICLDWLNKQPPRSVLFVSFGAITSFSDRQIKKLAMGLEQSKQRFIWVLRDADRGDIF